MRYKRSFEDSVVHEELIYWGKRKTWQLLADGTSPKSCISELMSGSSPRPGHRLLIPDMSPRAWQINARVFSLPTDYVRVLLARFCMPVKPNTGEPHEGWEIAEALGISPKTYWARLAAAKAAYRAVIFKDVREFATGRNRR